MTLIVPSNHTGVHSPSSTRVHSPVGIITRVLSPSSTRVHSPVGINNIEARNLLRTGLATIHVLEQLGGHVVGHVPVQHVRDGRLIGMQPAPTFPRAVRRSPLGSTQSEM